MIVSIYENIEDGKECYVALPCGAFAPLSLHIAENIPDTVWAITNEGGYGGVCRPRNMGRILFQIVDREGNSHAV